jgi:hypothetical protein
MSPPPPHPQPPRSALKRFAIVACTGALLGFVLFCVFGPRVMGWWYTPPAKEAFSCGASVSDALGEFVKFQLGAAVAGALAVLLLVALVRRLWTKFTQSPPPQSLPPGPAAASPAIPSAAPVTAPPSVPPPGGKPG